jgi:hypothetical protein
MHISMKCTLLICLISYILYSNLDNYIDAFKEIKKSGINIFRFYERIHQFHGTGIWWSALKQSPDPKKLVHHLISFQGLINTQEKVANICLVCI